MCNPISGILSESDVYMPDPAAWTHSHTAIAALHKLRDGELGDRLARFELCPPQDPPDYRSDQSAWQLVIDEQRKPAWYTEDEARHEDRIRRAVKRWLSSVPDHIVPGYVGSVGSHGAIVGGERAIVSAGYGGTATAGKRGTATAGDCGTATAGYGGTATAGFRGTATAGDGGTATAGYGGTATAGNLGTIAVRYWDGTRYRLAVGYVGEDGIEPNVAYVVRDGKLVTKEAK